MVCILNFINNELIRINNLLAKNDNKNVLYESKHTKFSLEKCNNNIYKKTDIKEKSNSKIDRKLNILFYFILINYNNYLPASVCLFREPWWFCSNVVWISSGFHKLDVVFVIIP